MKITEDFTINIIDRSWNQDSEMYIYLTNLYVKMKMTLKEYLDSKRKSQIKKKENRPMKVKVKEIIEYYARFEKEERKDPEFKDDSQVKAFISQYVDDEREE